MGMPEKLSGLTQTYDSALILGFSEFTHNDDTFNSVITKYGRERSLIWKRRLRQTWINTISPSPDSGFVVAAWVYLHPEIPYSVGVGDSLYKTALLKFDKCGKLIWAKYFEPENPLEGPGHISSTSVSLKAFNLLNNNGYMYLSCNVSLDDRVRKNIMISKLDQDGNIIHTNFFEGNAAALYTEPGGKDIYLTQTMYIPKKGDTSSSTTVYLFTGIKKLDSSLALQKQEVLGYYKNQYNEWGPMLVKKEKIIQVATARYLSTNDCPFFAIYDKNLGLVSKGFYLDNDGKNKVSPYALSGGVLYGDSIVTTNVFSPADRSPFDFCTSLRLYDGIYALKKKVDIVKGWAEEPVGLWKLDNGFFLAGIKFGFGHYSSLFLYERNLNPVLWPSSAPSKGYDWACTNPVSSSSFIDVPKLVERVFVRLDTTRVNWDWLWDSTSYIKDVSSGKIQGQWLIYPQPASTGQPVTIRLLNSSVRMYSGNLKIVFYDLQGKRILETIAVNTGGDSWIIPAVSGKKGLFLIELSKEGSEVIGKFKLLVQ